MIITICGSCKFRKFMIEAYKKLSNLGHIVLLPAIGCAAHDETWYLNLHFKKIEMSDAIFVVDVNGYVGESTISEINKAMECGKIIYRYSNEELID